VKYDDPPFWNEMKVIVPKNETMNRQWTRRTKAVRYDTIYPQFRPMCFLISLMIHNIL